RARRRPPQRPRTAARRDRGPHGPARQRGRPGPHHHRPVAARRPDGIRGHRRRDRAEERRTAAPRPRVPRCRRRRLGLPRGPPCRRDASRRRPDRRRPAGRRVARRAVHPRHPRGAGVVDADGERRMIPSYAGPTARLIATTVLVAVAVGASMLALTALVLPGDWVRTGLVGIALVAATTGITRALLERRARGRGRGETAGGSVVPTLCGAAVAAWYVLATYGAPTSQPQLFIGSDAVGRVVDRLGDAGEIIRSEVAPVPGTLPITLLT